MKPTRTWILMANAGQARICLNEGLSDGVHEIDGMSFENEHLPAREIMADKPGRAFDSVGGGRHAMEYASDPAEHAEEKFARHLSAVLDKALAEQRYDRLSVAAGPSMLARLRSALTPQTRGRLHAEIDKDYTKTPVHDLADVLRRAGAFD
ncbi:MAG: host attachment protein [Hyphomicrobiales bacterium]|nr:host attachment protein [Hyphomicrobiales bacterium]